MILTHSLLYFKERGHQKAIRYRSGSEWTEISWIELYRLTQKFCAVFKKLGIKKGSRVALICNTKYEWAIVELTCQVLSAELVPIYPGLSTTDIRNTFDLIPVELVLCDNLFDLRKVENYFKANKTKPKIVTISLEEENHLSWKYFLNDSIEPMSDSELEKKIKAINPTDISTILLSSGSEGDIKAIPFSYEKIGNHIHNVFTVLPISYKDISLAFLPFSHVMGRLELWGSIYLGYCIAYAKDIDSISSDILSIKPTIIMGVPRVFEKVYSAATAQSKTNYLKYKLFKFSLKQGSELLKKRESREPLQKRNVIPSMFAYVHLFKKVQNLFGGNLRFAFCGGAPIRKEVIDFFHTCGVKILEGYGLSETLGPISFNTLSDYKLGKQGKLLSNVKIKISSDGEILVKYPFQFEGYMREKNSLEAFENDWFKTGDLGFLDEDRHIKITGRKKELLKTAGAKLISPKKITSLFSKHSIISHVFIYGDEKKYLVALITLEELQIYQFAKENNISYGSFQHLTLNPAVRKEVHDIVTEVNSHLASFESIKNFIILDRALSMEEGELTPSQKIRSRKVIENHRGKLDSLYR